MKKKHAAAILRGIDEAEKWAFGISTGFGRAWKKAYQEARRTHSIQKSLEIAEQTALRERGGKK